MKRIVYLDAKKGIIDISSCSNKEYETHQVDLYRDDIPQKIVKVLRRLSATTAYFSLGSWRSSKERYDYSIIPDGLITKPVLKYLSKHPIADKQIVYYWNMIRKEDEPLLDYAKKCGYIIMTYNKHDAEKHNLLYNSQCWDKKY